MLLYSSQHGQSALLLVFQWTLEDVTLRQYSMLISLSLRSSRQADTHNFLISSFVFILCLQWSGTVITLGHLFNYTKESLFYGASTIVNIATNYTEKTLGRCWPKMWEQFQTSKKDDQSTSSFQNRKRKNMKGPWCPWCHKGYVCPAVIWPKKKLQIFQSHSNWLTN